MRKLSHLRSESCCLVHTTHWRWGVLVYLARGHVIPDLKHDFSYRRSLTAGLSAHFTLSMTISTKSQLMKLGPPNVAVDDDDVYLPFQAAGPLWFVAVVTAFALPSTSMHLFL